ncbi:MAG: cytochrome c [Nitrospira sp.]|nr:cytochrome c [Nitrospira sp.]
MTAALLAVLALAQWTTPIADAVESSGPQQAHARGRIIYNRACLWCHGADGRGDGPAGWAIGRFASPRPRDFVEDGFKFRSTPSGHRPTDQDLFRIITRGIAGTMPPYTSLSESERWDVIAYITSFNPESASEPPLPLAIPTPPLLPADASIAKGRHLYETLGCPSCHDSTAGNSGTRTDLLDSRGLAIRPTDLRSPKSFKNGARPEDIYRTLITGLDGTPMPSYAEQLTGQEDDGWHLANYILSLSADRGP